MTQMMKYEAKFGDFAAVPTLELTTEMTNQLIAGTEITANSILQWGERRDTTVPDIVKLVRRVEHTVDPAAPAGSYQHSTAPNALLTLTKESIAQLKQIIVIVLDNQDFRLMNDSDQYIKVYQRRFGPMPTTGKPVQFLGDVIYIGPQEQAYLK